MKAFFHYVWKFLGLGNRSTPTLTIKTFFSSVISVARSNSFLEQAVFLSLWKAHFSDYGNYKCKRY